MKAQTTMRKLRFLAALLPLGLLAGCTNDAASYIIDGDRNHALIYTRIQDYFWSDETKAEFVVAWLPECQRRHRLPAVPLGASRLELFGSLDEGFKIRFANGDTYAADTQTCELQRLAVPPKDGMGPAVGVFEADAEGVLRFKPAAAAAAPAQPATVSAPAAQGGAPAAGQVDSAQKQ